jgi:poly(A) polymerase
LITGRELIAAGYSPGARFKEMLRVAEDAQLEGTISTAEEALKLVREKFPFEKKLMSCAERGIAAIEEKN